MSTSPTTRLIVTIAPCRNGSHSIMVSLQDDLSTRVGHNDRGSSAPTRNATFVDAVQAVARAR